MEDGSAGIRLRRGHDKVRRSIAVFALAASIACGGPQDTIEGDLAATTQVAQIDVGLMEPVGRDRYGFTSPSSEPTLDVFEIDARSADRLGVYPTSPGDERIRFVRNPVARGALGGILDPADSVVVLMIPLLDPTRDLDVDFDAFFVALDAEGNVVASDYADETTELLSELIEFGEGESMRPVEVLAAAVRGLSVEAPTDLERRAAAIITGG